MKKQLTQKQRSNIQRSLQRLVQPTNVVTYCFANKQSGSGLFSHERLILINQAQRSIRYYSKQPQLPLTKISEIGQGKIKIVLDKVKQFKCQMCKGKTSTIKIQWQQNKKLQNWIFSFFTAKVANQFVAVVEDLVKFKNLPTGTIPQGIVNSNLNNSVNNNLNIRNSHLNVSSIPQQNINNPNNTSSAISQNLTNPTNQMNPTNPVQSNLQYQQYIQHSIQPSINQTPVNSQVKLQPNNNANIQSQYQSNVNSNVNNSNNNNSNSNVPITKTENIPPPPPPLQTQLNPLNSPHFGDVASQIKALRQSNYHKFNLTNQLSNKNLNQQIQQKQQLQEKANSNVKQSSPPKSQPKQQPLTQSFIKHQQIQPQIQPQIQGQQQSIEQSRNNISIQPNPVTQKTKQQVNMVLNKKANQMNDMNKSNVTKINELIKLNEDSKFGQPMIGIQKIRQSNALALQQQYYYQQMKKNQELRKIPSKAPLASIKNPSKIKFENVSQKSPAHMSQYYDQIEQQSLNNKKENKSMHRVHSQQQNLDRNIMNKNNSRIKSELGYVNNNVNNDEILNVPKARNNNKKWNEQWCSNNNNQVQIYENFIKECQKISMAIIDQLPFNKAEREYVPFKYQTNNFIYHFNGIIYNMHYFSQQVSVLDTSRDFDERAPILFNQQTYTQGKREFYNYNYILAHTGNQGFIKIPLSCYIEYKGIMIFCKAMIPQYFEKSSPKQFERQIENLQEQLKMRFIFNSISVYSHPNKKYILIAQLDQLLPRLPVQTLPASYFRKEFLLNNEIMIDDQRSLENLYRVLLQENIKNFILKYETLDSWIINSQDFLKELHRAGISSGSLSTIYEQANSIFFRKVVLSEMVKGVFCDILRSELNSIYSSIPIPQQQEITLQYIDKVIVDCTHVMFNQLFSYSSRSQNIWRMIVKGVNKRFKVIFTKQDIIPGYLLGGIVSTLGIDCDFKVPQLDRKRQFFIRQQSIPKQMFFNFYPKVRRYDLQSISSAVSQVQNILSSQPSVQNFQQLIRILDLKNSQIPSYFQKTKPQILAYLCNFIPLGDHEQFDHIGIYQMLEHEPHTACSTKISLLAIKWAAKKRNEQLANKIFEIKHNENLFWVSQFNPAISQYYDFFSLYNVSIGNYQESLKLARASLLNSIKLTSANSLPVADKQYQIGNILFKIGKKQQALKRYQKTQQILQAHHQTTIPQYGVILLKLSLLYLNFGKISDCVWSSLQALKVFDDGGSQQDKIQTFEILARAYQITKNYGDLSSVGILCSQKFNSTEDPKIFVKMLKIVIYPKLLELNSQDRKTFEKLLIKLQQLQSPITYIDSFNYFHIKSQGQNIMKKVINFIENISDLYQEVNRKDLFRKHRSLSGELKSQASQMLVIMEAIASMTGYNFLNGALKDH